MTENSSYELLVTEDESLVLEAIAQSVIPHSLRAQALLAVDAGSTVDQAAAVAGLNVSQVRYWIGRFRKSRLQVFPEELLEDVGELIREKQKLGKPVKQKAKKSAKAKSKKEKSGSGKKGRKKSKTDKKKKEGKSKNKKKNTTKKSTSLKKKKNKKKKAAKKKGS